MNILIPSVINVSSYPFSYTKKRSCFTGEERYLQTLNQVKELHNQHPNLKVYLLEGSSISDDQIRELSKFCNVLLLRQINPIITTVLVDVHPNKSCYEVFAMLYFLNFIYDPRSFGYVFKIGGRYSIDPQGGEFITKFTDIVGDSLGVFRVVNVYGKNIVQPTMFLLNTKLHFERIRILLTEMFRTLIDTVDLSIEDLLYRVPDYRLIDRLGVTGRDGIFGITKHD